MKIWRLLLALPLCVSLMLLGCDADEDLGPDDDIDVGTGDPDTGDVDDSDAGDVDDPDAGDVDDPDTGDDELPMVYRYVRVCALETEDEWQTRSRAFTSTAGPDIDAVEIVRENDVVGYAAQAPAGEQNVREDDNGYADPSQALGEPTTFSTDDGAWVSLGWKDGEGALGTGNFITLWFDFDIAYGDDIFVYELGGEISGLGHERADDPVRVLVSLDGENWVYAGEGGLHDDDARFTTGDHGGIAFVAPVDDGNYLTGCFE